MNPPNRVNSKTPLQQTLLRSTSRSKDFKKKPYAQFPAKVEEPATSSSKFQDLQKKLIKQKQMYLTCFFIEWMKSTGKRFRDTASASSISRRQSLQNSTQSASTSTQMTTGTTTNSKTSTTSATSPVKNQDKRIITKISLPKQSQTAARPSTAGLDREKQRQSANQQEVLAFLKQISLDFFFESLLQQGFDDMETLAEVPAEILNKLMMRAPLQKRLYSQILKYKQKSGQAHSVSIETDTELSRSCVSSISSRNGQRLNTQQSVSSRPSMLESAAVSSRRSKYDVPFSIRQTGDSPINKKQSRKIQPPPKKTVQPLKGNWFVKNSSVDKSLNASSTFFTGIGGDVWVLPGADQQETLIKQRKACCECFKVTYEWVSNGIFYYCGQSCLNKDKAKRSKKFTSTTKGGKEDDLVSLVARTEVRTSTYRGGNNKTSFDEDDDFGVLGLSMTQSIIREYK